MVVYRNSHRILWVINNSLYLYDMKLLDLLKEDIVSKLIDKFTKKIDNIYRYIKNGTVEVPLSESHHHRTTMSPSEIETKIVTVKYSLPDLYKVVGKKERLDFRQDGSFGYKDVPVICVPTFKIVCEQYPELEIDNNFIREVGYSINRRLRIQFKIGFMRSSTQFKLINGKYSL